MKEPNGQIYKKHIRACICIYVKMSSICIYVKLLITACLKLRCKFRETGVLALDCGRNDRGGQGLPQVESPQTLSVLWAALHADRNYLIEKSVAGLAMVA